MKSILSLTLLVFLMGSAPLMAQGQQGYCQDAESTSDLMDCTDRHLKIVTERMRTLYDDLFESQEMGSDEQIKFQEDQLAWLTYRDGICEVEKNLYEGEVLSRLQTLYCEARLTAHRVEHFQELIKASDQAFVPEFSNPPRWVNVLRADYKDIFWNFSGAKSIDSDCDGTEERLIHGLKPRLKTQGDYNQSAYDMILAIADSDKTGRPSMTIMNFKDDQNCILSDHYDVIVHDETDTDPTIPLCQQTVVIGTQSCGNLHLQYNNGEYSLTPEHSDKNNKK